MTNHFWFSWPLAGIFRPLKGKVYYFSEKTVGFSYYYRLLALGSVFALEFFLLLAMLALPAPVRKCKAPLVLSGVSP